MAQPIGLRLFNFRRLTWRRSPKAAKAGGNTDASRATRRMFPPMKSEWPADKVERRAVAELTPYARNARTHSDEQVSQIAASIREWGWTVPILVDERGEIIAGHGRVLAAQRIGIEDVPCMVAAGWSEAQRRAYVLADNKLTLNGGWNDELLRVELQDLDAMGFDLEKTGFGIGEMAAMFDEPDFAPGTEDDQSRLDQLSPKMVTCPHCGGEWDLREHGQG